MNVSVKFEPRDIWLGVYWTRRASAWPSERGWLDIILVPAARDDRRLGLRLSVKNVAKEFRVATVVATAFLGPRPIGHEINHIDGNHANNAAANLEYVTKRANEDHAVAHALHAWGDRHGMAKLTREIVRLIRASTESPRALAARYGVKAATIRGARDGRTWRHLDTEVDRPMPTGKTYKRVRDQRVRLPAPDSGDAK